MKKSSNVEVLVLHSYIEVLKGNHKLPQVANIRPVIIRSCGRSCSLSTKLLNMQRLLAFPAPKQLFIRLINHRAPTTAYTRLIPFPSCFVPLDTSSQIPHRSSKMCCWVKISVGRRGTVVFTPIRLLNPRDLFGVPEATALEPLTIVSQARQSGKGVVEPPIR